jgi:hypothetical protein
MAGRPERTVGDAAALVSRVRPVAEARARYRVGEAVAQSRLAGEPGGAAGARGGERPDLEALRRALGQPRQAAVVRGPEDAGDDGGAASGPGGAGSGDAGERGGLAAWGAVGAVLREAGGVVVVAGRRWRLERAAGRLAVGAVVGLIAVVWPWEADRFEAGAGLPPFVPEMRAPVLERVALVEARPGAPGLARAWSPSGLAADLLLKPAMEAAPGAVRPPEGVSALVVMAGLFAPAAGVASVPEAVAEASVAARGVAPALFVPDRDAVPVVAEAVVRLPGSGGTEASPGARERVAAAGQTTRVVVHYRRAPGAGAREALTASLRGAGFARVDWRSVAATVDRTQTQYFHDADRDLSERAASVLAAAGRPASERDFTFYAPPTASGTVEVWLGN